MRLGSIWAPFGGWVGEPKSDILSIYWLLLIDDVRVSFQKREALCVCTCVCAVRLCVCVCMGRFGCHFGSQERPKSALNPCYSLQIRTIPYKS